MARSIAIVFAADFSAQLEKLAFRTPVWLVDSSANHTAAEAAWQRAVEWPHISVTLFRSSLPSPTGDDWMTLLEQIALRERTVDAVEVLGTPFTATARKALLLAAYTKFEETPNGFRARKG